MPRIVHRLLHCRLCWKVTFAVFLGIFMVEAVILVPSYRNYQRDLLANVSEQGKTALASAALLAQSDDPRDLLAALGRVTARTRLKGGALYRADGTLVGRFGETTDLRPRPDRPESLGHRWMDGRRRCEVIWPPGRSGVPFFVAARLDTSHISGMLVVFLWRIAGLVLLISVVVCGIAMLVLDRALLEPLLGIRASLLAAERDPENADRYAVGGGRADELGDMSAALDRLLVRVSTTHREELAAMVAMVDGASEGIIAYHADGRLAYANRSMLKLTGVDSRVALFDIGALRFRLKEDAEAVDLRRIVRDGAYSGEASLVAGEKRVPCYLNAGRLNGPGGETLRLFASVIDITELRQARENLERQNLELVAADRAKSEFLANMSHELRTPLNAIIGFSEIMKTQTFGPVGAPQYLEYLEDIHTSGQHLLQIVNDILDMSKIEAGELKPTESHFAVSGVVRAALRLIAGRAAKGEVTVKSTVSETLPTICADERMTKQILLNLLSNAVKFTPRGGRVTVDAHLGGEGDLEISVRDTGIGIAREHMDQIMRPFVQAETSLARKYEGTGLGLPLVKAMVELHGGRLEIESAVGAGTAVTVILPARRVLAARLKSA